MGSGSRGLGGAGAYVGITSSVSPTVCASDRCAHSSGCAFCFALAQKCSLILFPRAGYLKCVSTWGVAVRLGRRGPLPEPPRTPPAPPALPSFLSRLEAPLGPERHSRGSQQPTRDPPSHTPPGKHHLALTPRPQHDKLADGQGGILIRSAENSDCKHREHRHKKENVRI